MARNNPKPYMEMQMEELKQMHGVDPAAGGNDLHNRSGRPEDEEIANLYADAAEYEAELETFERELEIIRECDLKTLAAALTEQIPGDDQNYARELKAVVETGWKQYAEEGGFTREQLELVGETAFENLAETLTAANPNYDGDFEDEMKTMLIQRWEMYIAIKKEHIKEETSYIKALGLKPHYAKKVYRRYHGIA